jgi:hypothetical protein
MSAFAVRFKAMSIRQLLSQLGRMPFLLLVAFCLFPASAQAQKPSAPIPSIEPLEVNLLRRKAPPARSDVFTSETISEKGLTIPSLWWAKEQFAGKLVSNWLAYPQERRVDLVVNRQLWTLLDYMDRYRFINEFGTVARDYGYNIRVFNPQNPTTPLAAYTCNFSTSPHSCEIWFPSSSEDSFRVPSNPEVNPF